MGNKTTPILWWLIIVILTVLLGIYLIRQNQTPQVQAVASFNVGVNVTGITHYGKGDLLPYAPAFHVTANLNEIKSMGGQVIRVFVANKFISDTEAANRLDAFLATADTYNISVIASLIDFYDSGFGPQGVTYNRCDFNPCLLGEDFFGTSGSNSFRNRYKQFVQTVVNKNKSHSNIYAWEIGNELKYEYDNNLFISFMNEMSSYIKSLDPSRLISTGMMSAAHQGATPGGLYPYLTNFDIISVHAYDGDHTGAADATWAKNNSKKLVVGEIGFGSNSNEPGCRTTRDRATEMTSELNYWKNQGAAVALQWGFIADGLGDNGNGDKCSGMDVIWHNNDYDSLFNVFKTFNPSPSPTPTPTPSTCTVSWALSNNNPAPNTNITVTVYGLNDTGGWQDIDLWRDSSDACPGSPCSLSIQQSPLRFIYSNVNSDSVGNHTLKFTTNNGTKTCTPTKNFTASPTQVTQCPLQSPNPRVKDGLISTPILYNNFSNTTGICVVDDERASFISFKIPNYDTLKSNYFDNAKPPTIKTVLDGEQIQDTSIHPINLPAGPNKVYYIKNGGLTINNNVNIMVNTIGVIFVDGNLTINNNQTHSSNNAGLVFVVKGNVIIAPSVTRIDAVLISSGTIYTAGSGCNTSAVTASQLIVNGSLISLDATKPVKFCRTLGAGNNTTPAEQINQQPKYLVILKDIVADTLQTWSEIP